MLGRAALWGPAAVCAGGRRPAREIATREPDGSEWSISRPALALPPPTGTAARPSCTLRTLRRPPHQWCLVADVCSVRRLVVRPGPAVAHEHRTRNSRLSLLLAAPLVFRAPSGPAAREIATRELRSEWSISKPARALRTLRRPPHQWCLVADVCSVRRLVVRPGPAAAHEHRGQALRLEVCLVPPVSATPGVLPGGCMKEISPLRSTVWSCGVPV